MILKNPSSFHLSNEVSQSLFNHRPVVALETTVITHGLPFPESLNLALEVKAIINKNGATPATIGVLDGKVIVGMQKVELELLVKKDHPIKVSSRNLGICIAQHLSGGTTVAGSLVVCRTTGIQVFATGGIGGVHRGTTFDISADLDELARSPVIVVCAGAKSILDLPATLEVLESRGVPVIGYQTDEFPAFYSINSGLPVDARVESTAEIVAIAKAHWALGLQSAILVCIPPPVEVAMDANEVNQTLKAALQEAEIDGITRGSITPYLLRIMAELTHGKSLETNLALLRNNASLAAEIAVMLSKNTNIKNY